MFPFSVFGSVVMLPSVVMVRDGESIVIGALSLPSSPIQL